MKGNRIKIGKRYRITYKITKSRSIHWKNNLIPPAGTKVTVLYIREPVYDYPITIINNDGITRHCRASDLIRYEGENYGYFWKIYKHDKIWDDEKEEWIIN